MHSIARHIGFLVALPAILAACAKPGSTTAELRILETTDIHMHVVDYDYFQDQPLLTAGLARTAALIEIARNEVPNSVLVDNGDLLQGSPLGDYVARQSGLEPGEVHPAFKAMNLLDYTVGNLGNHDFNYGLDFLQQALAGAEFPHISANVFHDDGDDNPANDVPYFDQYLIIDRTLLAEDASRQVIRIGFIGFVPPQIMQWDTSHLKGRVVVHDIVDTALALVPEMKSKGADIVVAIPHSGLSTAERGTMAENTVYYLSTVPGIDAIMFGHSHRVFPGDTYADIEGVDLENGTINGVAASMPGFWGSHLGYVDLKLKRTGSGAWQVTQGTGATRPIYTQQDGELLPLVEPVDEILAAVREAHEGTIDYMGTAVGEISSPINSFFALVRDDASVQLVNSAQKDYVEQLIEGTEYNGLPVLSASAPFKTGGRGGNDYYTEIDAGEIALKHVADLYVYPNTLRAVAISGAEVREWLEMSAGLFNQVDPGSEQVQPLINPRFPSFNFDVIDGVSYRIDLTAPARYASNGSLLHADSHRIVDLRFEGAPIDEEQQFIVATNSYRAGGGGSFPGLDGDSIVIEAPDTNRDILANYIFDRETIDPAADGNWRFEPIDDDVVVTFSSSVRARQFLPDNSTIEYLGQGEDGSGSYRLRL